MNDLSMNDLMMIDGGINWDRVYYGTAAEGALLFTLAVAPEITIPAFAASCVLSGIAGAYTGYGIDSN